MTKTAHSLKATKLNLEAQVSSLRQDVSVKGKELGEVSAALVEAKGAYAAESAKIEKIKDDKDALLGTIAEQLYRQSRRDAQLTLDRELIEKDRLKVTDLIKAAYRKADEIVSEAEIDERHIRDSVRQLETESSNVRDGVLALEKEEDKLVQTITREQASYRELIDEYNKSSIEMEKMIDEGNKVLSILDQAINDKQARLDDTEEEWQNRIVLIEERETLVKQRESDLGVLKRRIVKIYKKTFPNIDLKI